ncbi:hypothetical protein [Saccharothrix hoggarensis]|uniref:NIPSNAP protein n=1 Tax=Saccharothrix hoggarensis TaxID=913853 RepID=A0ABW3QPI2_9PSEU
MSEQETWLLETRVFKVKPGTRDEFDRISREGTIPLMRKIGITVLAYGPSPLADDEWHLVRAFPGLEQRVELAQALYVQPEWAEFDGPVGDMMVDYSTALVPVPEQTVKVLSEPGAWS